MAQTDSIMSTPCRRRLLLLPLLSATQTPGAEGETEEGEEKRPRRGGWWANEHNEETDTDYPDPPPPSSIHLWVRISLFPMGKLLPSPPLPCVTPLFPQQLQPGEPLHSVWPITPLLAI